MKSIQLKFSGKGRHHLLRHWHLSYFLFCTFLMTGVTFSAYISSAGGSDSARVAAGGISVTSVSNTDIKMKRPAGDSITEENFEFKVSNNDSEVAIRYDVAVSLDEALPDGVTMELDGAIPSENDDCQYIFSDMGEFEAGTEETKTHTLTFQGDYDIISDFYEREITISVRAEQID